MNKVKKILTTLMAATLTVSTGLTSMPMFVHNVKAESKAETISSDTNNGMSQMRGKKSGKITKESKFPMYLNM